MTSIECDHDYFFGELAGRLGLPLDLGGRTSLDSEYAISSK